MKVGLLFTILFATSAYAAQPPQSNTCTYETFNWNIYQQRPVNILTVKHPYSELTPEEIDLQTGCTVCLEDQVRVQVGNLKPFLVCNKVADAVRMTIEQLLASGMPVLEVTAYRPGRTRNPLDQNGNRTGFSNHAYGAAIDINRAQNGLYDDCVQFGPSCRLIQGGRWVPGNLGALERNSPIVRSMREAGFHWGGEIKGKQKDFMHFSVTGY